MRRNYGLGATDIQTHDQLLSLYFRSAREAYRVLRLGGVYVLKTQDAVSRGRQRFTHIEVALGLEQLGFRMIDLFVLVQRQVLPISRGNRQHYARRNHSYFLVFRKPLRLRSESGVVRALSLAEKTAPF